jgi:hypothetical protein
VLSIRGYQGEVRICASCGQPCYLEDLSYIGAGETWMHFIEQWDGVFCSQFPMADEPLAMQWDPSSREDVLAGYPDTRSM